MIERDELPPPPAIGPSPRLSGSIDRPRPSPVSTSHRYSFGWDESPGPRRDLSSPRIAYNGQSLFEKFSPELHRRTVPRPAPAPGAAPLPAEAEPCEPFRTVSISPPAHKKRRCVTWPDSRSPSPTTPALAPHEPHSNLVALLWSG
ncbi:heat shock protein [Aureococcus anophagefferens]|uniref:Heat shock protein n=1 Tax=Aureococcus anophagefferens TaxID=44056 RepID=A0ABR1FUV4_AURAN|nr:hypothetical protein JL720_7570 [Aureococcus anophagefferens]